MSLWDRLSRHSGYVRLPAGRPSEYASSYTKLPNRALFMGAVILIISFVLNCVLLFTKRERWPAAFKDYQQFKAHPLLNQSLVMGPLPDLASTAYVTTLYSDSYAAAVATLGHSLRKTNTSSRLIVLYFPDKVSKQALCVATASGFVPHPVQRIMPPENGRGMHPHFVDQYTKLTLWTLDTLPEPVRALVYLDADMLVLANIDELFSLPYNFAAVPDVYFTTDINAGLLFIRPSSAVYDAMRAALGVARYPRGFAEQALLNVFFAADMLRLPFTYNGNIAIKDRTPAMWEGIRDDMRIIHYTDVKPFVSHSWKNVPLDRLEERIREAGREKGGIWREEMEAWGSVWRETLATYADHLAQC